ncbi:phosphoesterase [Urechidicola croceus]|uniref:Phosphoesterase n=1 Tax=Urechidicola croceus TaxID=1850246 RepID=A0A1D8PBU5_9FLAO|nr:phosphoesterase [Urechidicola croceus]
MTLLIFFGALYLYKNYNTQKKEVQNTDFTLGIIADCQYCDCDVKWNRYYRNSPQRLKEAVTELNKHNLEYTIHLGDFIDQHFESFDSIIPTWNQLKSTSYHVLGNHDFDVADSLKSKVFDKLNLKKRYYSIDKDDWKFIIIDGNDLSFHGALTKEKQQETDSIFRKIESDSLPYAKIWNGGISNQQFEWIEQELIAAEENEQKVGFYCHFPLVPIANDNLWNTEELQELIRQYKNVKVFMNGHNHDGAYVLKNKVHYITFKGMVDTKDSTSFSLAKFTNDSILIKGFGREKSRKLAVFN